MLELNLLNKVVNKDLENVHKVDKYTFFKTYLKVINNKYWAHNEVEVLAFIMSKGVSYNISEKGGTKEASEVLGVSLSQISNYKRQLINKGYLVDPGFLIEPLKGIVNAVQNHTRIKLTLPMELQ